MQSQMEAKLASVNLKSPGLKSNMPGSPSARIFSANPNRQSHAFGSTSSFLSPDTSYAVGNPSDAAATLAQQRAKLKAAGNATHRISARTPASSTGERGTWAGALGQVAERDNSPTQEISVEPKSSRPQRNDFSGLSAGSALPISAPRWRCRSRRSRRALPHCRQQLGEHGEHAPPVHVPEDVDGQQ